MNPFAWAAASVRQRGLKHTCQIGVDVLTDLTFDWRHGTDTMRRVETNSLETDSENRSRSQLYQATRARPFLGLLDRLPLPPGSVFVDMGSGKGRVLLLASRHPFKRVVGLEFSGPLCNVARQNVELFKRRNRTSSPIEVIETDVTRYRFREDENVFYLYNPFDAHVLDQVLANLHASVNDHPRDLWLIYNTPIEHDTLDRSRLFTGHQPYAIGGTDFRVYYTLKPDDGALPARQARSFSRRRSLTTLGLALPSVAFMT
jgi:SAM-dependent methyltransferase